MTALHPRLQALDAQFAPTPVHTIDDPELAAFRVQLDIKRDDLLHPVISGNKWRKLKYVLDHALTLGADTLISMGGAYSNHLHALAYAGRHLGLKTEAFIRGERPPVFNPTLNDLQTFGMTLHFVSRERYRALRSYRGHDALPGLKPGQYWLPEGGATTLALQGVREIMTELEYCPDVIVVACGTATTLAGLAAAVDGNTRIMGVAALKGADYLNDEVKGLLACLGKSRADWEILSDYHHGGFAKTSPELLYFIEHFQRRHGIPLEPVYTGKALYAVYDQLRNHRFPMGQRILFLHTGGLQGYRQA